ncbi:MAG: hypothetical protein KKC84_00565 [Candidatus Omnitrophica bacterium]|nr:hypothetical protein [Candidatus Omnitrophota bacterium]
MFLKKRGQSTLEYSIVIAVVIAALLALNVYLKRGVQGKLKDSADQIGSQFEPTSYNSSWSTTSSGETKSSETRSVTGEITSEIEEGETITRSQNETWSESAF